jgi:hypothetical protein
VNIAKKDRKEVKNQSKEREKVFGETRQKNRRQEIQRLWKKM